MKREANVPKLYTNFESGNSYKIRLFAALAGITLEEYEVDLPGDEHHGPAFLAINPRGEVPVLVDGERIFRDSAAILTWLAGTYAPEGWGGRDTGEQAGIIDWLAFSASWIQYGVFTARAIVSFRGTYNGVGFQQEAVTLNEARIRGLKSLEILETALTGQDWLVLGRPTIADISVFPYVALAPMGDIPLEPYPAIRAWINRIRALPGFIAVIGLDDPQYRRKDRP